MSGMRADEAMHGHCEAEIARLRKLYDDLAHAVHNQNLEVDGQTFAGKVLENQRLRFALAEAQKERKDLILAWESRYADELHRGDTLQRRVEALKRISDAATFVAKWVAHSPSCAFRGCTCESADRLPDALNEFHRQRRTEAALRRE